MPAVIFDLDGTLVDLFEVHYRLFAEAVREEFSLEFDRRDLEDHYGKSGEEILKAFLDKHGISGVDYGSIADKRRKRVMDELHHCVVLPGAVELLDELKNSGIDVAVGSSNTPELGEAMLKACGLNNYFKVGAYCTNSSKAKPAPDIFLDAASKLGVEPSECVVVEDSVYGITAAKAAGMKCVAVATGTHTKDKLRVQNPDMVVDTLEEVSLRSIKSLFNH